MITRDEAIEVAKQEFNKKGYPLLEYDVAVDPEATRKDYWLVWFEKKGPYPVPGGKHAVCVNKFTGRSEFMPGE